MKKFFIILFILMLLPIGAFAINSPTLEKTITCNPKLEWEFAEYTEEWPSILERIIDIPQNYIMLDTLRVILDKEYETVEWTLPIEITTENEPFILIIDSDTIVKQEVPTTEKGGIITDFTGYKPGIYYICFYIKGV